MNSTYYRTDSRGRLLFAALILLFVSILSTGVRVLSKTTSGMLPVLVNVPPDFKRVPMRCCLTPRTRILGFWASGSDENGPNINILQTQTTSTTIQEYLPTIVTFPGESFKFLGFETRCGQTVALISSEAMRGTTPMTGLQSLIVSQAKLYTITYMRPSSLAPDPSAVSAILNVCLLKPLKS